MASQGTSGISRIIKAAQFSWQGLKAAFKNEAAFRQEVILAIILIPLGYYLGQTGFESALLISVIVLVLIVELLNSGIEAIVDRVSTEHHELSGRAKDIGSAAVLLSLINAVVVWGLVCWIAFRAVNVPKFADFLISVEAELERVVWPTREQVIQATIVVLVVMFSLGMFLTVADIVWKELFKLVGFIEY